MESNNKDRFKNPMLWITVGSIAIAIITSYNQIGHNTISIDDVKKENQVVEH